MHLRILLTELRIEHCQNLQVRGVIIIVDLCLSVGSSFFSVPDGTWRPIGGRIVQVMAPDAEGMPLECAIVRRTPYSFDL